MTNNNTQQHIEDARTAYQSVRLSAAEKQDIKMRVMQEIKIRGNTTRPQQVSPWFSTVGMLRVASVFVLIALVVGTPVAFAAERSLPGDALYTVKTDVTEPLAAVFADDADTYQQSLLAKRASELRLLTKRGELNPERVAAAQEVLVENVREALARAADIETGEGDAIQDYQVIVALIAENGAAIEEEAPVAAAFAATAKMAPVDSVVEVADATSPSDEFIDSLQGAVASLQAEATEALEHRLGVLADATQDVQEEVVEELVADAVAAGEDVDTLTAEPAVDVAVSTESADIMMTTSLVADSEPAATKAAVVTQAAAPALDAPKAEAANDGMVEAVLRVHQRIAEDKAARAVDALTEDLEAAVGGGAAVGESLEL
ncbi:MAG: hypothetical protein RL150_463 [Candidatus Parcubacteria bacterium]|jgi:hypothetical protein